MPAHRPEKIRFWRGTIYTSKQSDQTVKAFCHAHQITRSNFDRWRRFQATEADILSLPSPSAFVPVHVVAEPMDEIVVRSGVVLPATGGTRGDTSCATTCRSAANC